MRSAASSAQCGVVAIVSLPDPADDDPSAGTSSPARPRAQGRRGEYQRSMLRSTAFRTRPPGAKPRACQCVLPRRQKSSRNKEERSMKIGGMILAAVLAGGLASGAMAQNSKKTAPSTDEEMMAEMMKLAKPSEGHERLKPLAGTWKTVVKMWDKPGAAAPQVSDGECTDQWILEGRFLKEECTGTFAQMPFQGMGITGYDNAKKMYVGSWIDTMGTGILTSTGTVHKSGKTFTSTTTMPDPASGKPMKARLITKIVDDNTHTFEMHIPAGTKDFKMMEITYTRK